MKNTQIQMPERPENQLSYVYLIPSAELAKQFPLIIHAAIEAEWGDFALEGKMVTANHHLLKYADCPAPCNDPKLIDFTKTFACHSTENIIVSHIDLDTVLGVMHLWGESWYIPKEFLKVAEFIDLNGPHHIHNFPQYIQDWFNAYWAWNSENRAERITEVILVNDVIVGHCQFFESLFNLYAENSPPLIEKGKLWAENIQQLTESKLLMETENYRVFSTDGVFCGANYYSPTHRTIAKVCISFNEKFKAITVSCSDGSLDCRALVQKLWGPEAGGHTGIAGSPRGQVMDYYELKRAVHAVKRAILKPKVYVCMEYTGECYYDWQCYPSCPALKRCVEGVLEWGNIVTTDQVNW